MNNPINPDRLYELLPAVYRQRDEERGYALRALLRVITEQVNVVESDIDRLYQNWFIETCEDWCVPYIGELIGYRPVHEAGEPGDPRQPAARELNKILVPRRDVANTIRNRRRKGTMALLELLARDTAGWPARAVEFYRRIAWFQHLDHQHLGRGRTADLRQSEVTDRLIGPFDGMAHTVDVRRVNSRFTQGRHNISSVGVFVWRLNPYPVTMSPAFYLDDHPDCYSFSVLGNDTPLYNRPQPETDPTQIAGDLNLPTSIGRRRFEQDKTDYYGEGKSLQIWIGMPRQPVPPDRIVTANLSGWQYRPAAGFLAVDPVRGRLAFASGESPNDDQDVWVSYRYAFSADMGGGEYNRLLSQPVQHAIYRVGEGQLTSINDALTQWQKDQAGLEKERFKNAVIEITDSGLYEERIRVKLGKGQTLQIRAANGKRPVISVCDTRTRMDALFITGDQGSRVTLDGLLILGRGVKISGPKPAMKKDGGEKSASHGDLCDVTIRHCTLVPGWSLDSECGPCAGEEPSLHVSNSTAQIKIEHSILGSIEVTAEEHIQDPVRIQITDSILDATKNSLAALSGPGCNTAYVSLTIVRSTVIGEVLTHAIALAENCIFDGLVKVARRQLGCVRFCYVPPDSRTPRRYECQPDLVDQAVDAKLLPVTERDRARGAERLRVEPQFNSTRYGTPTYCQLAENCAEEIARGADDESEMGVFHNLFQPQRAANLRARLDEHTPAGMDAGIIYAT
ncbi:MAG: hypothetical protein H7X97_11505 [Opitutaceae bacterium]|nr:hypothetical protein [Verrucomicrobiales bacterium]